MEEKKGFFARLKEGLFRSRSGFVNSVGWEPLEIDADPEILERIPEDRRAGLLQALAQDPRPRYQNDTQRVYGFAFAGKEIRFRVEENTLILIDITDKI